eukprot:COSAG05_NODE_46_length_25233_cov_40.235741_12_plen_253_part_00
MCISVKTLQRTKFDVSQKPLIQKMHTEPEDLEWRVELLQKELMRVDDKHLPSISHYDEYHQKIIRPPFAETSVSDVVRGMEATKNELKRAREKIREYESSPRPVYDTEAAWSDALLRLGDTPGKTGLFPSMFGSPVEPVGKGEEDVQWEEFLGLVNLGHVAASEGMKEQVGDAYQRVSVYYFKLSSMVQQRLTARQRVRHADQAMVALNHKIFEVSQELNSLEEDLMQVRVKIAADDDVHSDRVLDFTGQLV